MVIAQWNYVVGLCFLHAECIFIVPHTASKVNFMSKYIPYSFEYNVRIVFFFLRKIANINRMRTLIECEYYYFFSFFRLEKLSIFLLFNSFFVLSEMWALKLSQIKTFRFGNKEGNAVFGRKEKIVFALD